MDYNHIDGFMGKNANYDVFPRFMPFIDKYGSYNKEENSKAWKAVEDVLGKKKGYSFFYQLKSKCLKN